MVYGETEETTGMGFFAQVRVRTDRCPCLVKEIHGYLWDEKARARGEERPVKDHDHAMDALRYLCHTRAGGLRRAPAPA